MDLTLVFYFLLPSTLAWRQRADSQRPRVRISNIWVSGSCLPSNSGERGGDPEGWLLGGGRLGVSSAAWPGATEWPGAQDLGTSSLPTPSPSLFLSTLQVTGCLVT